MKAKINNKMNIGAICITAIVTSIILFLIGWALGCWLWSVIAVGIFSLPALNCWEFLGLYALCSILFKSKTTVKNGGAN